LRDIKTMASLTFFLRVRTQCNREFNKFQRKRERENERRNESARIKDETVEGRKREREGERRKVDELSVAPRPGQSAGPRGK